MDSPLFSTVLVDSTDAIIDNIKIVGQWRYNTDGIDMANCQNMVVKNCFVRTFDDTICVKAWETRRLDVCKNITIDNCVLWCGWGRTLELGLETACKEYNDITFKNCDLIHNATCCIGIDDGDYAEIHNVLYKNINIEYQSSTARCKMPKYENEPYLYEFNAPPLLVLCNYRYRDSEMYKNSFPPYDKSKWASENAVRIHDVKFDNINIYYEENIPRINGLINAEFVFKTYLEGKYYYNITIENLFFNGKKVETLDGFLTSIDEGMEYTIK